MGRAPSAPHIHMCLQVEHCPPLMHKLVFADQVPSPPHTQCWQVENCPPIHTCVCCQFTYMFMVLHPEGAGCTYNCRFVYLVSSICLPMCTCVYSHMCVLTCNSGPAAHRRARLRPLLHPLWVQPHAQAHSWACGTGPGSQCPLVSNQSLWWSSG